MTKEQVTYVCVQGNQRQEVTVDADKVGTRAVLESGGFILQTKPKAAPKKSKATQTSDEDVA